MASSQTASSLLWLAVYFPDLPLEVFVPTDPVMPRVVLHEQRVAYLNQRAQDAGIVAGCSLATAYSISSELEYFSRDQQIEQRRLDTLAQCLYRYSSMISIEATDCILVEIQGSLTLWGGQEPLLHQIDNLCRQMGHACTLRLGATPQAAVALARAQSSHLAAVPLHSLGLNYQGVSERALERLHSMGIYILGQLLQLPRNGLSKRFGKQLTDYLARLSGDLAEPREMLRADEQFAEQMHLLKPILSKSVLLQGPMPQLAIQLQHWLIAQQLSCTTLRWHFAPFNGQSVAVDLSFTVGVQSQKEIMQISNLKLETQTLPEEVMSVGLTVLAAQATNLPNMDLFGSTQSTAVQVNELVDELNARLGPNACYGLCAHTEHHPDQAWSNSSLAALNNTTNAAVPNLAKPPRAHHGNKSNAQELRDDVVSNRMGQRPLWLLNAPCAVAARDLNLLQGPERIQIDHPTGGIAGNTCSALSSDELNAGSSRDYYVALHRQGALCWVYCASPSSTESANQPVADALLIAKSWYLHGYFA